MNAYTDRVERAGTIVIEPILEDERGGTDHRWVASWAPPGSSTVYTDASGATLTHALVELAFGLAEALVEALKQIETST